MSFYPATPAYADSGGTELLSVGEAVIARYATGGAIALASGVVALTYFTCQRTESVDFVLTSSAGTAAAGLTYAGVGIYQVASSGVHTLVGQTANLSGSLWSATFTGYASQLSAAFTKNNGQQYALATLAVGTTPPTLAGVTPAGYFLALPNQLCATLSGQSSLPASIAAGTVVYNSFALAQAVLSPTAAA